MKRILVFSDSHGNKENVSELLSEINNYNKVIFLGDGLSDLNWYRNYFINKIDVVKGNGDLFMSTAPTELDFTVEGVNIIATHGHLYGVKGGLEKIENKATLLNSHLVLYGHTHKQKISESNGITFLNPGSLSDYFNPKYAEIEIEEKNFKIYLKNLDKTVDKKR